MLNEKNLVFKYTNTRKLTRQDSQTNPRRQQASPKIFSEHELAQV